MASLMSHVEYLSETIGPRPATTDAESKAADYIRDMFESRGLDAEIQSFDSPRTYAWAYVMYHLLTIAAAVVSRWYPWPALLLGLVVAVLMRLDLDTRWGLTSLMPKGPSQNVIARHMPRLGRGERAARVIVVAHYDSARASLAFSPGMVKNFAATFGLMKACTWAVPIVIGAGMLPYVDSYPVYAWYAALAACAYLVIPLLINVHRELFMRFTPGANDNASGVAAMLGVLERIVPEPDAASLVARATAKIRTEDEAWAADVVPDGAVLNYAPVATPVQRVVESWADDEDDWTDTGAGRGQTAMGFDAPASSFEARAPRSDDDAGAIAVPDASTSERLFGTGSIMARPSAEDDGLFVGAPAPERPRVHAPDLGFDIDLDDEPAPRRSSLPEETEGADLFGGAPAPAPAPSADDRSSRGGLFGRRDKPDAERHGVRDWLGVGNDFDARKKGADIGSWDNFAEDDDEAGWKGGAASVESLDDPDFAASEAARIRRKVTMNVDRELIEKEVWFVATGAEEVGTVGMKAFLKEFGPDLEHAVIINLDNVGTGAVHYITREGNAKRYESDRRLVGASRRAAREADLPVKGREYRGLSTDATPALARGFRAMSVMAFDINGRLPNWHWKTDTADAVSETNLRTAVDFVTALIKEM